MEEMIMSDNQFVATVSGPVILYIATHFDPIASMKSKFGAIGNLQIAKL